ncbi:MAG: hypothetical protein ACE5WD_02780 [Candidatus Aminicenantia bacterium]
MKKKVLRITILLSFITNFLTAQIDEAYQLYLKAATEQKQAKKIQLFKEFLSKYSGQGTPYEKYVYANLALMPGTSKDYSRAIEYGEKALSFSDLDEFTKTQLYIVLSGSYTELGQNLEKAKRYADLAIELAQVNVNRDSTATTPKQWQRLLGGGYYAKASTLRKLNQDVQAVDYLIKAYNILKNQQIARDLKKVAKTCYNLKRYKEAENACSIAYSVLKDYESTYYYAKALYRNGKKEQALIYFKRAYNKYRHSDIAYNIGIILAKDETRLDEAINYLAEATVLNNGNISGQAKKLLEHLYFNKKKGTKEEFEKLLKDAKTRLGLIS